MTGLGHRSPSSNSVENFDMTHQGPFDPLAYWKGLIIGRSSDDVDEVGHPDMGRAFNLKAYALRLHALTAAMRDEGFLPPGRVFEAAFGVGYYLRYWRELGCAEVAGVDLSKQARDNAQRVFPEYDLRAGDLAAIHQWPDWPTLRGSFSLVTAIDVLYHILDESQARQAVKNLGQLVAPGGCFLFTDKFPPGLVPAPETPSVTRRPTGWYETILGPLGLTAGSRRPVFWGMDPPSPVARTSHLDQSGYLLWWLMRSGIKFWPRNSLCQNVFGTLLGGFGAAVDRLVVPRIQRTANLSLAVYRRVA